MWAYCLMGNHVHLILVPSTKDGLRASLGDAHRQYTRYVNFREGCRGHLWQERFHSFAMDEHYLLAAVRYVELNPVHAHMVKSAEDYQWSSARAHLAGKNDKLVKVKLTNLIGLFMNNLSLLTARYPDGRCSRQTSTGG